MPFFCTKWNWVNVISCRWILKTYDGGVIVCAMTFDNHKVRCRVRTDWERGSHVPETTHVSQTDPLINQPAGSWEVWRIPKNSSLQPTSFCLTLPFVLLCYQSNSHPTHEPSSRLILASRNGYFAQKFVLLRPLLEFRWEIVISSKLEAACTLCCSPMALVADVNKFLQKFLPQFLLGNKGLPRRYQYFQKMSSTILRNCTKLSKLQKFRKFWDGIVVVEELDLDQREKSLKRVEFQLVSLLLNWSSLSLASARARAQSEISENSCCWRDLVQVELELELS